MKKLNELKKQQTVINQSKKEQKPPSQQQQKSTPPTPVPSKTSKDVKKQTPSISYEDLMRYASLTANKQAIPKELAHVTESFRANKSSAPSSSASSTSKKPLPNSKSSTTITNLKKPTSSSSTTTSSNKLSVQSKSNINKPKTNTTVSSSNNIKQPIRPSSVSSTHRTTPASRNQTSNVQRLPNNPTTNGQRSTLPNRTVNGQRPVLPNRALNGQRPINGTASCKLKKQVFISLLFYLAQKRPVHDTDDEDDDEGKFYIHLRNYLRV